MIRERVFRPGEDSGITDEAGRPLLEMDGKVLSLHDRLILRAPAGHDLMILATVLALDLALDQQH